MQTAIPCMLMRGGTSKGLYFLASDLPANKKERDALLLAAMGSPDTRQIDGVGGAHPLTSKVAVISTSEEPHSDIDYLFLQILVDEAKVSDAQNCGNILAGVGPFAIECGLIDITGDVTDIRIRMLNTGARAVARIQTIDGRVEYEGDAHIDGVPGTAAPVPIDFLNIAGSSCGALLPTGRAVDTIDGIDVTCIDNGMPVVLMNATDFGITGIESPGELEANEELAQRVEQIRLAVGPMMALGDVRHKTVPKMCLVSAPVSEGSINTRTFIPRRVHDAIGVLGSISVATACVIPGTIAQQVTHQSWEAGEHVLKVEHPTGYFSVELETSERNQEGGVRVTRAALLRTARLLMRGDVMVPQVAVGASSNG